MHEEAPLIPKGKAHSSSKGYLVTEKLKYTSFGNSTWLKLKKLSKLSLRSKLMTYVKLAVKSIVDNFINFDNFEQSDNFRKLSSNKFGFSLA